MNRKILQKVIDELNQPQPKLEYIKGILETVMETLPEENSFKHPPTTVRTSLPLQVTSTPETSEASILDAKARAAIEEVKRISEVSTHD